MNTMPVRRFRKLHEFGFASFTFATVVGLALTPSAGLATVAYGLMLEGALSGGLKH